jgi:NADPH2:quinone reductase
MLDPRQSRWALVGGDGFRKDHIMKAIRIHAFGDPEVMKLEEISAPKPAAGQILIDARAIGVNPVDTYIRAGKYGPREFPFTPGSDVAGVVESIGAGVTRFNTGDRVYTARTLSGAYAQKTLADQGYVYPLPGHITFAQGAAIGVPYGTAYKGLHLRGRAQPGETVFIHGATGGVGIAAVQLARAIGCTVIGTGGSDKGRQLALREGAHHTLDHTKPDYLKELTGLTAGRGPDLILEMLANVNLANDLSVLARFGRIVVIGSRGKIEIDPRETMIRDADIRGMTMNLATAQDLVPIHAAIFAGLENQSLRPIIDHELPLADAVKAHHEVLEGGSHGKIVLIP